MDRPLNAATPLDAAIVAAPLKVPELGFVVIVSVIDALLPVIVLPPASCTVTMGCCAHVVPPVLPPGCVVKPTFAAAPTVMLNVLLVVFCHGGSLPVTSV